jgi:hypothetical protein
MCLDDSVNTSDLDTLQRLVLGISKCEFSTEVLLPHPVIDLFD